jgi:hypothetical protein
MTSQICSILTNDGPPLVELVKVLQVQNILKSYNTSGLHHSKQLSRLKRQTLTVQFLW